MKQNANHPETRVFTLGRVTIVIHPKQRHRKFRLPRQNKENLGTVSRDRGLI